MSEKPDLLMTHAMMPMVRDGLEAAFTVHKLWEAPDADALLARLAPVCRFVATGAHAQLDDAFMAKLPALEIIGNFGVGYDTVDAKAAGARGIVVTNTPDVLTEEVADLTIGLMLATIREIPQADRYVREGKWLKSAYPLTRATLQDRKVGILGLGRIGKAIARRVEAFGVPVSYFGRTQQSDVSYPYYSDPVALAAAVDVLIIVIPGGPATRSLVNKAVLEALGPNGILINVARGSVVDEEALVEALRSGTILSAGLDVFVDEPNVPAALLAMENTVLLPHVGSATQHTRAGMGQLLVDNLTAWRDGKAPLTPVPETPSPR